MNSRTKPTTILFDLGNVLIELDGPPIRPEWIDEQLTEEESWQKWMNCSYVVNYESGKITANEFVCGVIESLRLKVDKKTFRKAFTEWPRNLYPGVVEMLIFLRSRYKLAFFSNTSDLHLSRFLKDFNLAEYFDHAYASYEIGFFKPDTAGFEYVITDMGEAPEDVLFIDDNRINVEGARAVGIQAEQAYGLNAVQQALQLYGCLDGFNNLYLKS